MQIRKENQAYQCNFVEFFEFDDELWIELLITESITPVEIAEMFENNDFYFYDEILRAVCNKTKNSTVIGLRIVYYENSTCGIQIILKRKGL